MPITMTAVIALTLDIRQLLEISSEEYGAVQAIPRIRFKLCLRERPNERNHVGGQLGSEVFLNEMTRPVHLVFNSW